MLRLAASLWGVATAIALLPLVTRPAPPGQLPGALTALNIDAHTPFRFFALLVALPLIFPWLLLPAIRIFESADTQRWARNAAVIAMLAPLWFVVIEPNLAWALIPTAAALIALLLLRRVDASFSRQDAILLPTFATVFLAIIDIAPVGMHEQAFIAAAIVFATRLATVFVKRDRGLPPAMCFAITPLGLVLQSAFFARDQRHFGWPSLLLAVVTPFLMRLFVRDGEVVRTRLRRLIAFAIFPIATYAYGSATSLQAAEGKPRGDLFESAHTILPGAEMLRGEKPYRDIIPSHGLVSDALLSYFALRAGPMTMGHALKTRLIVEGLNRPAGYLLALAATGSPEVGILSFFLAEAFGTNGGPVRMLPAMLTLALLAAALRLRDLRFVAAAGVGVAIAVMTGADFGVYSAIFSVVGALLFREQRSRALRVLTISAGTALAVVAIGMLVYGIFRDFVHFTFVEMPSLAGVYALPPVILPEGLKQFHYPPEVLVAAFDKTSFLYVLWFVVLVGTAAAATVRIDSDRLRRRRDALLVIAAFMLICAFPYAERHHLFFQYAMAPMIAAALLWAFRSRQVLLRALAPALVVVALMIAQPTIHLAIVASLRNTFGPLEPGWRELQIQRARGVYFNDINARAIETAAQYAGTHLRPDDTYFDFTNRGMLFFLLNRDCPIRQVEVAFYETEAQQREVIARIATNPHVRAALVPPPGPSGLSLSVDVPNSTRAPLVWAWLQQHFEPDFAQGDVVFWRRK
jgi:hypothetical protein